MSSSFRLVSWNILQGGGSRIPDQIDWLSGQQADIVCLQEFRARSGEKLMLPALHQAGLVHQYVAPAGKPTANTLLIASRYPFEAQVFPSRWDGAAHVVRAGFDGLAADGLTLFAVHFPQKKAQVPLFDALLGETPALSRRSCLLVGDLNCGIPFEDSQTKSFVNTHLFSMMLSRGWTDAWRTRHETAREFTWRSARTGNGFRYDHLLATEPMNRRVQQVHFDHEVRRRKLSDHSALIARFSD